MFRQVRHRRVMGSCKRTLIGWLLGGRRRIISRGSRSPGGAYLLISLRSDIPPTPEHERLSTCGKWRGRSGILAGISEGLRGRRSYGFICLVGWKLESESMGTNEESRNSEMFRERSRSLAEATPDRPPPIIRPDLNTPSIEYV
jgi:hypothetical protein